MSNMTEKVVVSRAYHGYAKLLRSMHKWSCLYMGGEVCSNAVILKWLCLPSLFVWSSWLLTRREFHVLFVLLFVQEKQYFSPVSVSLFSRLPDKGYVFCWPLVWNREYFANLYEIALRIHIFQFWPKRERDLGVRSVRVHLNFYMIDWSPMIGHSFYTHILYSFYRPIKAHLGL